jgi:hypothetical protein
MQIHHARTGGVLDIPMSTTEEKQHPDGIFLVERLRRALMKLDPQERLLFSTRLKGGPLEDMLIADEQLVTKTPASTHKAHTGQAIKSTTRKEHRKQKQKAFRQKQDANNFRRDNYGC